MVLGLCFFLQLCEYSRVHVFRSSVNKARVESRESQSEARLAQRRAPFLVRREAHQSMRAEMGIVLSTLFTVLVAFVAAVVARAVFLVWFVVGRPLPRSLSAEGLKALIVLGSGEDTAPGQPAHMLTARRPHEASFCRGSTSTLVDFRRILPKQSDIPPKQRKK